MSVVVPIEGIKYTLDLSPFSVRADDFVFMVQLPDGSYVEKDPGVARTLNGNLRGIDGSSVVGSMLETGLAAQIVLPDGREFFIEPLASKLANRDVSQHVVYLKSNTKPHHGRCGVVAKGNGRSFHLEGTITGATFPRVAQIAIDADFEYFTRWGTDQATRNRIELVIGIMNAQYLRDVNIIHQITTIIVRTTSQDPYTSSDPNTLLTQFRNHWLNNQQGIPRDVAHLFTGRNLNGGVIGIAFLAGICNTFGYGLVESDFNNSLTCATDLSAHEIGHNWDADHCNCPSYTMNPSITCANRFSPSFTIPGIVSFRNSRNCLSDFGALALPFCDEFPQQFVDTFKWNVLDGVVVNSSGANEPSEPYSAILEQQDVLESQPIDTSGVIGTVSLSFYLEERFAEAGDSFSAEYLNSNLSWIPVYSQDGGANGNQNNFDFHQFALGNDAKHSQFKIRLRSNGGVGDNWHVDNVCVEESTSIFFPTSFQVNNGNPLKGTLQSLLLSDDLYVRVINKPAPSVITNSVEIEVTGTVTEQSPAELSLTLEAATDGSPTQQRVEFLNYDTGIWDLVDARNSPTNDTEIMVTISSNAGRYIQDGTGQVKARLGYRDQGAQQINWTGRFDLVYWTTN